MKPRPFHSALACAAWLVASPALAQREPPKVQLRTPEELAQAAPPVQVAPLVVEGTTPAELKKQTVGFVQNFAAATPRLDRLARWTRPVCVAVDGLVPDQARQVRTRIEDVAKALNVGVAKPGCNPTIEIFFADDPQRVLDKVAATREDLLGYWHHRDREKLKTVTRPIQAWYVTATTSAGDGGGMGFAYVDRTEASADRSGGEVTGEVIDDPDVHAPAGCGETRFSNCMKSVFSHVLVTVNNRDVSGYSAGLLGDYVVMVAFAQPRSLEGCNTLPSIIDLFACRRPEPVQGLTRADVAYLTALYETDLEARKSSQESRIADRMADMLLKSKKLDLAAARH